MCCLRITSHRRKVRRSAFSPSAGKYTSTSPYNHRNTMQIENGTKEIVVGPRRIFPGHLSVSRTFGDPQAKLPLFGGKPGVVSAAPEIKMFKVASNYDCIVLATDGVYEMMSNKDIMRCIIMTLNETVLDKGNDVHKACAAAAECIVKNALSRMARDNLTVVVIGFKHFKDIVKQNLGEIAARGKLGVQSVGKRSQSTAFTQSSVGSSYV
eukprot:TRINITY_DN3793_c0_g5_i2.p1 TRINITY_DN3793_c0_g5~~TRINITY_DN3793_c0_g5_i2.p1  ORF type:complete len:210 (+),score=29.44 TRINITY_DN3793_c0_g5_i2:512-1141(+)